MRWTSSVTFPNELSRARAEGIQCLSNQVVREDLLLLAEEKNQRSRLSAAEDFEDAEIGLLCQMSDLSELLDGDGHLSRQPRWWVKRHIPPLFLRPLREFFLGSGGGNSLSWPVEHGALKSIVRTKNQSVL